MTEPDNLVICERRGAIEILTLNRPQRRNALSMALRRELLEQMTRVGRDKAVRAVVLTGAGGFFCSGGDIDEMTANDPEAGPRETHYRMQILHDLARCMIAGPKPVVAAVEGPAFGAGLSLALACDHVVAGAQVRMSASFGRIGLMADTALLWTLPLRVGYPAARRILLSARVVEAQEALRIGLVDDLVDEGKALEKALQVATDFTQCAPLAAAATKSAMASGTGSLEDALAIEAGLQIGLTLTQDHREGVAAFLQKRPAVFGGR